MSTTLVATFDTRRQAEMAVEHLVQKLAVERTDIFLSVQGEENSAGLEPAGSDAEAGLPSPEARDDAALEGAVVVSVDVNDEELVQRVADALEEFEATQLERER